MSIEAVRAGLVEARELLRLGYEAACTGQQHWADAARSLAELGRHHPEASVPPQLPQADEHLSAALLAAATALEAVDRLVEAL